MKGCDDVLEEPLWPGTSKGAEGELASRLFSKAKSEGANVEINVQDIDSSSGSSVEDVFPDITIVLCGGHVGRAHFKKLQYKLGCSNV